jgi:hypothetical protein
MGISPLYSIRQYSEEIYKVAAFKNGRSSKGKRRRHEQSR